MDLSGFIDGYYSFNFNRPNTSDGYDQLNQLYNFNDKTDQFELSAAKLTLNHDPDPIGAHVDFIYGRTNELINTAPTNTHLCRSAPYLEQAFLSLKPPKAKGFELDFGKFVTSAGAEVIEAKDNWNYSRSLLVREGNSLLALWRAHLHAGVEDRDHRLSVVQRMEQRLQVQWRCFGRLYQRVRQAKVHLGPELAGWSGELQYDSGLRNLIDTTLLLTPPGKVNAYINFDYGLNQDAVVTVNTGDEPYTYGDNLLHDWWGAAGAVHIQAKQYEA